MTKINSIYRRIFRKGRLRINAISEGRKWNIGPQNLASMAFSKAQKKYSTFERELAGIRWGMKTFKNFLIGIPLISRSDHQSLTYLYTMRNVDFRLARTLTDLQEFDFEIEYIKGKDNDILDDLSRNIVHSQIMIGEVMDSDFIVSYLPPGGPDFLIDCLYTKIKKEEKLFKRWKKLVS